MNSAQKKIVRALKNLEKDWPSDGTMIMANGNFIYLCTKHPQDGGTVLESFDIPSDGGDPDWQPSGQDRERPSKKKLVRFKPPSIKYKDLGVGPLPDFTGDSLLESQSKGEKS